MSDSEFLRWLAERLVFVYKESPNVDFVTRTKEIATRLEWGSSVLKAVEAVRKADRSGT